MKRKVEVFVAGCAVCEPVVELVNEMAADHCDVIVYDIAEQCDTEECVLKVKDYGVSQVPAIAVDGKLLDCCANVEKTKEDLIKAGIVE
ncbi:thioredoxin family protein [Cytophagaceae bacterium ABcell3]|nr:thioredoxin family protein [Cytophagaceae bacterium ABcell3]